MSLVKVAVAQLEHAPAPGANLDAALAAVSDAGAAGAQLVAFPETFIPGYPAWLDLCRDAGLWDHPATKTAYREHADGAITIPGPEVERLAQQARAHMVAVVLGAVERVTSGAGHGTLYNALITIGSDGTLLNHHRKTMPTHTERLVWGAGDARGVRAVDTSAGRVGGLICWEHWMPLARQALHESTEHIHVAAWPQVKEMNLVASRHYAFEGRCYVLCAGAVMRGRALPAALERVPGIEDNDWVLRGGSCVIAPDGSYVTEPVYDRPQLIVAEIDTRRIVEESMTLDVTGHYSRPDLFRMVRVSRSETT
ncbi:MAG: carbon-nitrogen hydrolase family protein [Gemmatimonadota bacterium]